MEAGPCDDWTSADGMEAHLGGPVDTRRTGVHVATPLATPQEGMQHD